VLNVCVNNEPFDLPPGTSLSLVTSCPIFDRDRVGRAFSYPFRLPKTPANLSLLKHVSRLDSKAGFVADGATLMVGGGLYESGELVALGSNEESIEVTFRNLPLTVAERLGKIYINEILDTITIPNTGPDPAIVLDVTTPPFAYFITIGGISYTLGIGGSSGMTHAEVCEYFRDEINADYPGLVIAGTTTITIDSTTLSELEPNWNLMTGFAINSYITVGKAQQISFLNYVEDVVATPVDELCWPCIRWEAFYEGKNGLYNHTVNPVFAGVAQANVEDEDQTRFEWAYVPMVRLPYILEKIREAADLAFVGGYVDDADIQQLILVNNRSCDLSIEDYYENETYKYLNAQVAAINLNDHVPKMTALDFLKRLGSGLNFTTDYEQGGMVFTKVLDRVNKKPEDWSPYVQPKSYDVALPKAEGIHLLYPTDGAEGYINPAQLAAYDLAPAERRQEMPFNSLYIAGVLASGFGVGRSPITRRKGISVIFGGGQNSMGLCLLFYRGTGTSSLGASYPYATHDEFGSDGATVIGGLSLALSGDLGLVEQNFGDTLLYADKRDLSIDAVLPIGELYRLRKWENARVRFYHREGVVIAVLKSVEFRDTTTNLSGLVSAKIKAIIQ